MSATIDGAAWTSIPQYLQTITQQQKEGHVPLYGATLLAGNTPLGITLNLFGIQGPGTYPLGVAGGVSGGTGAINEGSRIWLTPISGAAGTVTITTLTATRAVGTFQFVAEAAGSGALGSRSVTNGKFDFPITPRAGLPPMTEADTGFMAVTAGGGAWYGAAGGGGAPANGVLFVIYTNTVHTIAVTVSPYNGPGTYQVGGSTANLGNSIRVTSGTDATKPCCWGGKTHVVGGQLVSLDAGTITITSATASRIRGTFSGVLAPGLTGTATTSLALANGSFSYGFP